MFLFDLLTQYRCPRWAPLPLRLIVGFGFMQHGLAKLSKGPDAFAAILQAMHVPAPQLMAWLTISTEIGGGLAVLLGGFVALAAVPMAAVLLVAAFTPLTLSPQLFRCLLSRLGLVASGDHV